MTKISEFVKVKDEKAFSGLRVNGNQLIRVIDENSIKDRYVTKITFKDKFHITLEGLNSSDLVKVTYDDEIDSEDMTQFVKTIQQ
jgi:translation initiation factor 1 (eIF-1/SUI1)